MADYALDHAFTGDLREFMRDELRAAEGAVTTVVRRKVSVIKNAMRRQVRQRLPGHFGGIANAVHGRTEPAKGRSIEMAGFLESTAFRKSEHGPVDLFEVATKGADIVAVKGQRFLAIPLKIVGKVGTRRRRLRDYDPTELIFLGWSRKTHSFGPRGTVLVVRRSDRVPLFILVRHVRDAKKLDLVAEAERLMVDFDEQIATEFERRSAAP